MPPAEFKKARHTLGLSLAELAHILSVDPRTIRKWEADHGNSARLPNPTGARVMEWMLGGFRPPEFPSPEDLKRGAGRPGNRRDE